MDPNKVSFSTFSSGKSSPSGRGESTLHFVQILAGGLQRAEVRDKGKMRY